MKKTTSNAPQLTFRQIKSLTKFCVRSPNDFSLLLSAEPAELPSKGNKPKTSQIPNPPDVLDLFIHTTHNESQKVERIPGLEVEEPGKLGHVLSCLIEVVELDIVALEIFSSCSDSET